ncbi:DUF7257 domain-containing protein [Prescottella agglutinans]|uniref:DUF7257 domain-containing protein n=1 Tax=Prescottella agglutinans TaxID=1644129 RepID=UPI003CC8B2E6
MSGAASVTGTASARAYASGAVAGEALITGQAQVRWTDNFDRLSAPIGTNWITSSLSPFIYSGAAQCPATSTSTSVWALTTIDLGSDDQSVTALIVAPTTPPASEESGLALRSGSAWATGTHAELAFSTGKGCSIKSVVNGAATVRASTTTNISYGDTLEFRAVGNVYTAYRNGSSFLTWTDSGNIVAVGPSRRRFGFYAAGIKTDKVYFTPAIDWIAGQDL